MSEEIAQALGDLAYWQQRAVSLQEQLNDAVAQIARLSEEAGRMGRELTAARELAETVHRYLGNVELSPFILADAVDAYERARRKEGDQC